MWCKAKDHLHTRGIYNEIRLEVSYTTQDWIWQKGGQFAGDKAEFINLIWRKYEQFQRHAAIVPPSRLIPHFAFK